MRAVLDTSVVVSSFLSPTGAPGRIIELWRAEAFEVLTSEAILAEYGRALAYGHVRARHGMSDAEIEEAVNDLRTFTILVHPHEAVAIIKADPADDMFLECAVSGRAEYIVSRDAHLLDVGEFRGIQILLPAAFLAVVRAGPAG